MWYDCHSFSAEGQKLSDFEPSNLHIDFKYIFNNYSYSKNNNFLIFQVTC